jgi:CDP-glucose 4,6-dehydratase
MFHDAYNGKKVLITGHTGFKGSWLSLYLKLLQAEVVGYALEPNTDPSLFKILNLENKVKSIIGNILDTEKLERVISDFSPDIIFHLAAQPLVRTSYKEPVNTYQVNVIGTLNVLEAARKCANVKAFINVTTDKCYENMEINYQYKEDDKLGGYDMYSSSKACSEILSSSYRNSFLKSGFLLATARAGNIIGGGDWALDRLIPDCIRAIRKNIPIMIRNPHSVRPWQFVLEPLCGYLMLGEKLLAEKSEFAKSYNFGPEKDSILSVNDIIDMLAKYYSYNKKELRSELHEANLLMLDISRAKNELSWYPKYNIRKTIEETIEWYKNYYNKQDMYEYTVSQIENYVIGL